MPKNSFKSVKLLSLSLSLVAVGCSQAPTHTAQTYDISPQVSADDKSSRRHSRYHRLHFHRSRHRTESGQETAQYETVWDRLLSLYALPEIDNPRIDREIDWYLRHPDSLISLQQRAEPYLHHILEEVEAKDIPGEFALLPIVESSFKPEAFSKAAASGLWQFIPSTGKLFGLKQNSWYDGRRDVYASTKAATLYLKQLSEEFSGDWLLALASYNYGKGNVRKCMDKNADLGMPTDYWSLPLPDETYHYVPKLLAVARIFANADYYGIPLRDIPNEPYFEVVDIKAPLDLNKAARMANTSISEFRRLNPGFNRWCTAPDGPHRLLIPVKNASLFKKNLAEIPFFERVDYPTMVADQEDRIIAEATVRRALPRPAPRFVAEYRPAMVEHKTAHVHTTLEAPVSRFERYKVQRGDSLTEIARDNHTTVQELQKLNHLHKNTVNYGSMLKVPAGKTPVVVAAKHHGKPLAASKSGYRNANVFYHTVKKGDTYFNISRRYSITPKELAEWNHISLSKPLLSGSKLAIKGKEPQVATSGNSLHLIRYTVKPGDSLTQLAKKFNTTVNELKRTNPATLARGLQKGQVLKILVDGNRPT